METAYEIRSRIMWFLSTFLPKYAFLHQILVETLTTDLSLFAFVAIYGKLVWASK